MDVGDAVVMFFDERHGRNIIARDEVSEIDVCAVIFRKGKRLLPMGRRRSGMAMIAHHKLVLVGKAPEAF